MTRIILPATIALLLAAAPAAADRAGHAAVRAPAVVKSIHAEFTLPGGPWGQVVGAMAGTTLYGTYGVEVKTAGGTRCRIYAGVDTLATKRHPAVTGRVVAVPSSGPLRFDAQGRHGAVHWWAGKSDSGDAAAAAVQPMPARLRSRTRQWLVYTVSVTHLLLEGDKQACAARARKTGTRTVRSVVRTLALVSGPPRSSPPFALP